MVAAVVIATTVLTACSSTEDQKGPKATLDPSQSTAPTGATPSQKPSASATGDAAKVQAAYEGYWDESIAAYAKGTITGTKLKKYAVAYAYSDVKTDLAELHSQGFIATGKPTFDPVYGNIDSSRKTPRSTFTDCVDITKWTLVKKATGKPVELPKERLTRYVSHVTAEKWYGHWVIVRATQEEKSC
jgi:hypothetical protein